jgi:hypothetical protein
MRARGAHARLEVMRERLMALCFALGSTCFLVGPFPGYAQLVGAEADAITFFAGSILFTAGGLLQVRLSRPGADRWAAVVQSAGTLFFNVTTYRALDTALSNPHYDRLVWRPDAFGSICFLVSGVIAYRARGADADWTPMVNLLGCVFFGIAAAAGYVVPATGSILALGPANFTTALGAACFLACAVRGLSARRPPSPPPDSARPRRPRAGTARRAGEAARR